MMDLEWLTRADYHHRIPLNAMEKPDENTGAIAEHLGRLGFEMQGCQITIDGKALRGSRSGETTHLHAVSARACEAGITLAQARDSRRPRSRLPRKTSLPVVTPWVHQRKNQIDPLENRI